MFLKKKWLTMLAVMTALLLLAACGEKDKIGQTDEEEPIYDNPRNHTAEDFMPISEGLEKYPIWFSTREVPDRESLIDAVSVFENGEVTEYRKLSSPSIEEIIDLTDDEIIQYAKENSQEINKGKYTLDITLDSLGQYTEKIDVLLEDGESLLIFGPEVINQKIFDTTFSGLNIYSYQFTRVDDSFVGFKLDDPDTNKKNVTIEGK